SITNIGTITSNGEYGIYAGSAGGNITIQGVGLIGGITNMDEDGISVNTRDVSGTSRGTIMIGGAGDAAIGDVSGSANGIYARTDFGDISITSANVTGSSSAGITAQIGISTVTGSTADITIDSSAGSIEGDYGIVANNYGSGAVTITAGNVSSGSGAGAVGIMARTRGGANITLALGSTISGGGASINTEGSMIGVEPSDRITLMGAAMGAVNTNAGDDVVTLMDGGSFGLFDGGSGFDRVEFAQTAGVLDATFASTLSNIELIAITEGTTMASGVFSSPDIMVASGAMLDLASGASLTTDLTNAGGLSVAGIEIGSATITGALMLDSNGRLVIDATMASGNLIGDSLVVSGAVLLGGSLVVRPSGDLVAGEFLLIDGSVAPIGDFDTIAINDSNGLIFTTELREGNNLFLIATAVPSFRDSCMITRNNGTVDFPLVRGDTLTCVGTTVLTVTTEVGNLTIEVGNATVQTSVAGVISN
ncbi:MAG: hypothetical protein K8953_05620, partial [Proteobacteria bacterium]|nr:hypothetical protein [Pseudomonadota bacterium]